jgi:hypothetical protein
MHMILCKMGCKSNSCANLESEVLSAIIYNGRRIGEVRRNKLKK